MGDCGRPNAGKSSLLNALAGREAAVSPILPEPPVMCCVNIFISTVCRCISLILPGCEAGDEVERIGIERARQEIAQADRVLFMVDGTTVDEQTPEQIWPEFMSRLPAGIPSPLSIIKPISPGKPPVSQSGTAIR